MNHRQIGKNDTKLSRLNRHESSVQFFNGIIDLSIDSLYWHLAFVIPKIRKKKKKIKIYYLNEILNAMARSICMI